MLPRAAASPPGTPGSDSSPATGAVQGVRGSGGPRRPPTPARRGRATDGHSGSFTYVCSGRHDVEGERIGSRLMPVGRYLRRQSVGAGFEAVFEVEERDARRSASATGVLLYQRAVMFEGPLHVASRVQSSRRVVDLGVGARLCPSSPGVRAHLSCPAHFDQDGQGARVLRRFGLLIIGRGRLSRRLSGRRTRCGGLLVGRLGGVFFRSGRCLGVVAGPNRAAPGCRGRRRG